MKNTTNVLHTLFIAFLFSFVAHYAEALVKYPPEYAVLPNGMKVIAIEDNSLPIISAGLFFDAGEFYESCGNNGMTRIYKQLLLLSEFKDETRFEFNEKLEKFGITKDFSGGQDIIYLGCTGTALEIEKVLDGIYSLGFSLNPTNENFETAKEHVTRFSKSQKRYPRATCLLEQKTWQRLFKSRELEYNCPIDDALLNELKAEHISNFSNKIIQPNKAVLVVTGNLKTDKIFEAVNKKFSKLKIQTDGSKKAHSKATDFCKIDSNTEIVEYADIRETEVIIGFEAPAFTDPKMPAAYILQTALNDYHKSPLKTLLKNEFPEAKNIFARYLPGKNRGLFTLGFTYSKEHEDRAIYSVISKMNTLKSQIPSEKNLKNIIELAGIKNLERFESRIDRVFYTGLAEILGDFRALERLDSDLIAVDTQSLKKTYEEIFVGKKYAISVMKPLKYKKQQETNIFSKTLENGAKILINNYPGSELAGLTILIDTQTGEKNIIYPLLAAMIASYINDENLNDLEESGLIGARIEANALSDCLIIRGKIRNNKLIELVRYIKNLLTDTKFYSKKNFENAQNIVIEGINQHTESPIKLLEKNIRSALIGAKTHEISENEIRKMQYNETMAHYKKWAYSSSPNIVAVGSFNPESTMNELSQIFASLPKTENVKETIKPSESILLKKSEKHIIKIDNSPDTSYIAVAFRMKPVIDKLEIKDFVANSVLAHVLYGSDNAIIKQELKKIGAFQEVTGNIATNKTSSIMSIYAAVPANLENEAIKTIENIISGIPNIKVSQDNIIATKMKVISEFVSSVEKPESRSAVMAFLLWNGLKDDLLDKLLSLYSEITPDDVYNAAKLYYNNYYMLIGKP